MICNITHSWDEGKVPLAYYNYTSCRNFFLCQSLACFHRTACFTRSLGPYIYIYNSINRIVNLCTLACNTVTSVAYTYYRMLYSGIIFLQESSATAYCHNYCAPLAACQYCYRPTPYKEQKWRPIKMATSMATFEP